MYVVGLELSTIHLTVHILFIPSALMIVLITLSLASSTRTIKNKALKQFLSPSYHHRKVLTFP